MTDDALPLETALADVLEAGLDEGVYRGAGAAVGDADGVTA